MIGQISGNDLRRRRASRLAGALGLLLALALIGGVGLPAYVVAQIPSQPMGFAGTASTVTPAAPVPAGTLVQAYVGDELRGETTTKAGGAYDNLLVPGPGPGTVTFRVAGVLAQESIAWAGGELTSDFSLTIPSLPGTSYSLTTAVSPAGTGNATDVTNASPYAAGVQVSMDSRGRALDNIMIERLWRSVKYERIYLMSYATGSDLRAGLTDYFDFYNTERPHQSLAYRTPKEVHCG